MQPVEQIVLKPTRADELLEVAVGRRDDAYVHVLRPFPTERLDFTLLQDATA